MLVVIVNLDLPISTVSVQCGGHSCLSVRVDTFLYIRNWIRVRFGYGAKSAMVDAKLQSSVFPRHELYDGCPFGLCWVNDVFRKHILYFGVFEFSSICAGAVWGGIYRCCVRGQ